MNDGDWLRAFRERHRWSVRQAAAALGVSHRTWEKYESRQCLFPADVKWLCAALDFVYGVDEAKAFLTEGHERLRRAALVQHRGRGRPPKMAQMLAGDIGLSI